jgi:5'-nucleotidase
MLSKLGEVWVIAPEGQRSGAGRSVSSFRPIRTEKIGPRKFSITGTPADAVILAKERLMDQIDLAVSGINLGANVGIDTLMWSGTCGAAFEAASFGIPSVAISAERGLVSLEDKVDEEFFSESTSILEKVCTKILKKGLPEGINMLNINVPQKPSGTVVSKLGKKYLKGTLNVHSDENGEYFLIGGEIEPEDIPGTDVYALHHERKTVVTPITLKGFDLNISKLESFLEDVK